MSKNRVAGEISFKVDGTREYAKGSFTYNLGGFKRDPVVGSDEVHGFKETPKVPFIEGEITDRGDLDLKTFQHLTDVTVTLELVNGKTIILRDAWYAHDGDVTTEEAVVPVRFEGRTAEEMTDG
ncbi:MAG: phage tail tube protein [Magnetovibrionaceae bacterium]